MHNLSYVAVTSKQLRMQIVHMKTPALSARGKQQNLRFVVMKMTHIADLVSTDSIHHQLI